MPDLTLQLLGPVYASYGGEPLTHFRTKSVQALLIYLACQPEAHRRESLMALLWPDIEQSSAQNRLRQSLYHLRQTVPEVFARDGRTPVPFIIADRQLIQVNPEAANDLDVAAFENLLRGEQAGWSEAVALYRGDFLCDFYLPHSAPFEEWAAARRADLKRQALEALHALTAMRMEAGNLAGAEAFARQQLAIDNLNESAHRQLMTILAQRGQRSQALAQYELCRQLLADELAAEPAPKTQALYESIRSAALGTAIHQTRRVRGFELQEVIGAGAFAVVHRALQPTVGREVAVKIIQQAYANQPDFIRRFEAEAQTVARLEHPFIVPLYDYWREPDGAYLVMRWLRGGSLAESLATGPWPLETAVTLVDQIAGALHYAHQHGVVHRDIKPANILLDEEGNGYLSDFGIAKAIAPSQTVDRVREGALTENGLMVGSPAYVSPEQILNEPITPLTDLYSLGIVLFELLTGSYPFPDAPPAALISKHLHAPLPSLRDRRPELPAELDSVIDQATSKNPAERYTDAAELAAAFRQAASGERVLEAIPSAGLINPYKGLRPFQEADAADFFGRHAMTGELLERLAAPNGGGRFLAVVGPSGSGKSSVVKAGLLPALRQDALSGSSRWFVVDMTPGTRPLDELEIGLLRVAVRQPTGLGEQLRRDAYGLVRAARLVLPDDGETLLLIVDQFEELFTAVSDPAKRDHFLKLLATAAGEPNSPLRIIITLRADFYDRPLLHAAFGRLVRDHTAVILPLTPAELAEAVSAPAERAGVALDPGLITTLVADVAEEAGALPLFQFALTELFNRRDGRLLTAAAYEDIGGVSGAIANRAEEIYATLRQPEREVARQLFLRLVTLGEGVEDTRRRVLRSELEMIQSNPHPNSAAVTAVIDTFGQARLLTFDRDPSTRAPTVEVAHEALLHEWERLRGWLDESRDEVRWQRRLAAATAEWLQAGQDEGFLLRGSRLEQFAGWAAEATVAFTQDEQAYLQASLMAHEARQAAEEARRRREIETARQLAETERRRAEEQAQAASHLRRRALFLAGALAVAAILALLAIFAGRQANLNAQEADANYQLALTREGEALTSAQLAAQAAGAEATAAAEAQNQQAIAEARAREAQEAFSQSLAAHADNALADGDSTTGLALALAANNIAEPPALSQRMLRQAAYAPGPRRQYLVADLFPDVAGRIYSLDMSPVAQEALIGFEDGTLVLWDVNAAEEIRRLDGHEGTVRAVAFSPDGQTALSGGSDHSVILWDLATGEEIRRFEGHDGWVRAVDFSPDGQTAVSGGFAGDTVSSVSEPGQLILWDLQSGEEIHRFEGHPSGVVAAEFTPDGRAIVASSGFFANVDNAYSLMLWNVATGVKIRDFAIDKSYDNFSLAISPDGQTALTGNNSDDLFLWDLDTGEGTPLAEDIHTGNMVTSVAFTPDGRYALTGDANGLVILWDIISKEPLMHTALQTPNLGGWHAEDAPVLNLAISPDGRTALSSAGDGTLLSWDLIDAGEIRRFTGHQSPVLIGANFTPDGKRVLTSEWGKAFGFSFSDSNNMYLWDVESGEKLRSFEGHEEAIIMIDVSADGRRALTGSQDGTVRLWDLETGDELQNILAHTGGVFAVALSPDERMALTASMADDLPDSGLTLWDLESEEPIHRLVETNHYTSLLINPDGRTAYAEVFDEDSGLFTLGLYDLEAGELIHAYKAIGSCCTDFALHPDGQSAFMANNMNGPVVEWDLEADRQIRAFGQFPGARTRVEISPDGRLMLVSALTTGNNLSLWDLETGQEIRRFSSQGTCCIDMDMSPDGTMAVTPAGGGTAILWDLTLPVDTDEVRAWIAENRYVRELTCGERALYRIEPLCDEN